MLLATVAMAFSSCSKEVDVQEENHVSGKMKTITVKTDIATRTTLDSGHQNIVWAGGEKISLFNDQDNTITELSYSAGGDITVQVPAATNEIYMHYPHYDKNTNGPTSVSVYIRNDQTQTNPGELNGYNFPMVAKGTVSADNKALVQFYPVASALALNIYKSTLGETETETVEFVKVTPAAANTGFYGSQSTDITADAVKYTSAVGTGDAVTVTLTNGLSLASTAPSNKQTFAGQIYVCLAKQSYANVKFEIKTDKGTYTVTSNSNAFDLVNNDFVPVNINLNKAQFTPNIEYNTFEWNLVTSASQIVAGAEVVIASKDYAVAMSQEQKTNNRGQVEIEKDGNTMGWAEGAAVQVFEVVTGSANNSYGFKCVNGTTKGQYIYAASSESNHLKSQADLDANASWAVTIASSGAASLTAQGSNTRNILRHNNSSTLFACYSSASQGDVVLYIKGEAIKEAVAAPTNVEAEVDGNDIIVTWVDVPSGVSKYVVTCTGQDNQEVAQGEQGALFENLPDGTYTVTVQAIAEDQDAYKDSEIISIGDLVIGSISKGDTWSYTFVEKVWSAAGNQTLRDKTWNMTGTGGSYFAYDDTKGQQFGSGNNPYSALTLSSNFGVSYGIDEIRVSTSGAKDINATVSVSVGGTAFKCENSTTASLTISNTVYAFVSPDGKIKAGDIEISYSNSSSKAIYIKKILVNPAAIQKLVMSDITCTDHSSTSVTFGWSAVTGATGYQVSTDGGSTYGSTQQELSYTWSGREPETDYTIWVKALGDGSEYSDSDPKQSAVGTTDANVGPATLLELDMTTKAYGASAYNTSTDYGDWTIVNGANNNKGWTYFKMGGKSATLANYNPCYIYSTAATTAEAGKVTVHIPAGSLSKNGMSVNSWGVYVYSDPSMSTQVDYVAGGTITSSEGSFDFEPSAGKTWASGSYFKVSWDLANTTTTNGVVCVDKITVYGK